MNTKRFLSVFRRYLQILLGIREWRDELDTLHYFLNAYHDASCAPPTNNPDLRIMQLCNVELLRIFTSECDKKGLVYWLDYGTLLGAVRHKGFIPWDDDMDIAMPRQYYNRVFTDLKDVLSKYDIELYENYAGNIGVGYNHNKTGLWLDVFAVDDYFTDKELAESINYLETVIPKYRKKYEHHKGKVSTEWMEKKRQEVIGGTSGKNRVLYHQPEFRHKVIAHPEEVIYPLSKILFEGYSFSAPNKLDLYLNVNYGYNYMGFPKTGILCHGLERGELSSWAKRNGVNMQEVLSYLQRL